VIKTRVRSITAAEAFPMRRYLLRPMLAANASHYAGDEHPDAIHLGAFADLGDGEEMVGVVSFLPRDEHGETSLSTFQLQGMVTLPAVRNQGVGAQLAEVGITRLVERGATRVWCNGRTAASSFYQRLGFEAEGDEFITPATGPHYRFVRILSEG
jgi:predicted N-acetyltransferase YhbS